MTFERDKLGALDFRGMNLLLPPDLLPPNKFPYAQNCRRYKAGGVTGRARQDAALFTVASSLHSLRRLNDLTPNGPPLRYVIVSGAADKLYVNGTQADGGYSGKALSLIPFRPAASVQPWMYVGDSEKMSKVRSDGTSFKMGIAEPQVAPTVQFVPASDLLSLLGDVTVYVFNNPSQAHNAPLQSIYLWRNAGDKGPSTFIETADQASVVNTGNSLLFDLTSINGTTPVGGANAVKWSQFTIYTGTVSTNGTAVTWDSGDQFNGLAAADKMIISGVTYTITGTPTNTTATITATAGVQTGANYSAAKIGDSRDLYAPQLESEGFQDFNCSIVGTFYVPVAGTYSLAVSAKDDFMWGIGNAANGKVSWPGLSGTLSYSSYGQTKTTINAYPLIPRQHETSGENGFYSSITINVTFSAPGNYPFEIDWDYWYRNRRGLMVTCNGHDIPPIPPSAITDSQYCYIYRSSETGAKSNRSPRSPQSPLSVLSNNVQAVPSSDPQADKIDFYRLDRGLSDFTYVGTIGNSSASTTTTQAITANAHPQAVKVASADGIGAGSQVSVDSGGNQETVSVLGAQAGGDFTVNVISASAPGSGPHFALSAVTFIVDSLSVVTPGDVIDVSGNSYDPFNGAFNVYVTLIEAGPTYKIVTYPARWVVDDTTGTGGTLSDRSKLYPTISGIFTKNHASGVAVLSVPGVLRDTLLDVDVANNPILELDNFEPFPSIDLPRKGSVQIIADGAAVWIAGDKFNMRWLPGTVIVIGAVAYTLDKRPVNDSYLLASNVELVNGIETSVVPPDGFYSYEISEPILAAQPLPYLWGPTDNVQFAFACGDLLRPGTLYWSKGNNLDSAPDTNQEDVTSPAEPLMNGCIVGGFGLVFSSERRWFIWPNYFNALATVKGTVGDTWTLQEAPSTRGLYIPRCLAVEGGGIVFLRAKDGIYMAPGGTGDRSITDEDLWPLFPHEGMVPQPVTIGGYTVYPPDDTKPDDQRLSCATGYLYYDYKDTGGNPRTLAYDIAAGAWSVDLYQHPATIHVLEEGPEANTVLTGCGDGSVRRMTDTGAETGCAIVLTPSFNAGDTRAQKQWGDVFIEVESIP